MGAGSEGEPPLSFRAEEVPGESAERLLRDLRSHPDGLGSREASRRLEVYGPNELRRKAGRRWPQELAEQVIHPLALLLWAAAGLAALSGAAVLAWAIVAVIVVNAVFAFVQERQAQRAVEALRRYLPAQATVLRDGEPLRVDARQLVPGDVIVLGEGDTVPADARLLQGSVEVDLSALTGESQPAYRSADLVDRAGPLIHARDVVFSGASCTGGEAQAVVYATGMHSELGRIAALSHGGRREPSPLERQVRRVAWVIAWFAVGAGLVFLPVGILAGLPPADALVFAIGLLVANVPEGLLPTITLALAVGVKGLARAGAVVKQLSAVETLGSTTVICTDKTGTLTENRMTPVSVLTSAGPLAVHPSAAPPAPADCAVVSLAAALAACSNAELAERDGPDRGDPTEVGLLRLAEWLGQDISVSRRTAARKGHFHFDPNRKLMSTVDLSREELSIEDRTGDAEDSRLWLHTKGSPEAVLRRCAHVLNPDGTQRPLTDAGRRALLAAADRDAQQALRVLGVARRRLDGHVPPPAERGAAEQDLTFLGLVAMLDPPRVEVPDAVARCHNAGVRIVMITGDHPLTAGAIAARVGIVGLHAHVVTGADLARIRDADLDHLLRDQAEVVFARTSPEDKLRIAEALRAEGHVVAMTGDGVNDAPALHRADIGVAMGRSGTDVSREAATMVLTDDNFATVVQAVQTGRQVYDNVRKFVLYIFAHATPEVVPFLLFALSGGAIPLPLTVIQILAIDLGTETLPALALGREPPEPGVMTRPPRPRSEGVIQRHMLGRAWGLLGGVSAVLVLGAFFVPLLHAGWYPGAGTGPGTPLHEAYLQATTMTFLGIVACQIGTAFAARSQTTPLSTLGMTTNRLLLWGVAFEIGFCLGLVYFPPAAAVFGMAPPEPWHLALLLPFPLLVWAPDEARKIWYRRTRSANAQPGNSHYWGQT